ncbi:hypothetical protein D3C78_1571080 [compost metagenome]
MARGGQVGAGLGLAVVVAREAIALRANVQVVQVGGDFRCPEAGVVAWQIVVDAADHRMAIVGHYRGAELLGRRVGGAIGPDLLLRIGRVEYPVVLHCPQLVVLGIGTELRPALVAATSGLAAGHIGQFGGRGGQIGDAVGGHYLCG